MTEIKQSVEDLLDLNAIMINLKNEIREIQDELANKEISYNGKSARIDYADCSTSTASISYIDDDDKSNSVSITLDELLEILEDTV